MRKSKILVIDDELAIRRFLAAGIDRTQYELIEAEAGLEGLSLAARENPDVILLDLGLPDLDGVEVMMRLREWSEVPVIILSARGDEMNKVHALDAGANDYLTKPFGLPELFARIRAALRTSKAPAAQTVITVGDLSIDLGAHLVYKGSSEVHLTPTEYRLLVVLAKNLGKVVTHRQLLTEVWGPEYADELHYLRVYAQQLRVKIEDDPTWPKLLLTETGVGYRLRSD